MKRFLLFITLIFVSASLFAQQEVPLRDVNYVEPDSLLKYGALGGEPVPPLTGQTVTVTGVVMTAPYRGANPDSAAMLHAGAPAVYLQDLNEPVWGGVLLRDLSGSADFAILDTGMVIKVTGTVVEYFTTTEFDLQSFEASNIIGIQQRPKPVVLTLDSFFVKGTNQPKYLAEKWEGVYVEFQDVMATDQDIVGSGTFKIYDDNNTNMVVYNKGDYIRNSIRAPLPGTVIKKVRGYIETRTGGSYGWFMVNPIYKDDIVYGDITPPIITNARRDRGYANFDEPVRITAKIQDPDKTAPVREAKLFYSPNDAPYISVDMKVLDAAEETWYADIPAFYDSTYITYYIKAVDELDAESYSPTNYSVSPYSFFALNRDLKIADVQYSPYGGGYSAFQNYSVTVKGIVTSDTSDIAGFSGTGTRVQIQDGTGPWSGIQIFGTETDNLKRGDQVTVTGTVNEDYGYTRIGTLDNGAKVTVNQSGVEVPEAVVVKTATIGSATDGVVAAEKWEGMLIKFEDVTVFDDNADGNSGPDQGSGGSRNFGEMSIVDDSGTPVRVELQEGTHSYHNAWDATVQSKPNLIKTGDKFDAVQGILYYSFGNYKLIPRKDDDFIDSTAVGVDDDALNPFTYGIAQNYPNPFNPTTVIKYSIAEQGMVKLSIYNVLGQEVASLVNEVVPAGIHQVQFNGSSLASGIYMYSISVNNFHSVKKMMLVK